MLDHRAQALRALYEADARDAEPMTDEVSAKAARIATGVWRNRNDLDDLIDTTSTGWRVERMPAVDLNVLRIAVWELHHTVTPVAVIISEAVKLAKEYSTERSGAFVNGVLGALSRDLERH